jgi:hypothetical protein
VRLLAAVLVVLASACTLWDLGDKEPSVPNWEAADQAGNSSQNQHGFMVRRPADAGSVDSHACPRTSID